ncbi:MAG: wax ester/triacylglycerol synthase family O-acyltransferase [Janibacter sp.]|nr:wax ester/triacylglycerol synthase family O-acyltransferase [Janibacter sp.]
MERLGGLDTAFLGLEALRQTGHVGSLVVLDPDGLGVPFDRAHLRALLAERVGRLSLFRKRLQMVPFGLDRPYWVDDPDFDLDDHVRASALPAPGARQDLVDLVARLHERPLDMTQPLWETYLITGLEGGRCAVYMKVHHAMLDGLSGVELLTALVDLEPGIMPGEPAVHEPSRRPSGLNLLGRAASSITERPKDAKRLASGLVRYAPALAINGASRVRRLVAKGSTGEAVTSPLRAPSTPFNGAISAQRRIGLTQLPLADLKTIKNAFGVSVNDVVLAASAAAVRQWLIAHDASVGKPLVTMIPVALPGDRTGAAGNSVTAMFTPLPVHLEDPVRRLTAAHAATVAAKSSGAAVPADIYEGGLAFAPPIIMAPLMRNFFQLGLFQQVRTCNLVVSNIPGPDVTLYLGGAVVEALYPVSIITDGMGLNITLQGLGENLNVGVLACRDVMPDVQELADAMRAEVEVLLNAAR